MMNLPTLLAESNCFHSELSEHWSSLAMPETPRGRVVAGYCAVVREHVLGQQQLLALGFEVTAMALVRPSFEALVRAIWSLQGASDDWVTRFLTPSPLSDVGGETVMGPPVDMMLESIERHHPTWVHQSLKELKHVTWKPMHSYVHGGIRPVLHALAGPAESQSVSVVLNGNGFVMLASNVLQIAAGAAPGRLAELQRRFVGCLPPLSPPPA